MRGRIVFTRVRVFSGVFLTIAWVSAFFTPASGKPLRFGSMDRKGFFGEGTGSDPVLVGAGDIAECGSPGARETALLLDQIQGVVFTVGDHAYPHGTGEELHRCYGPAWGRHKMRTRPSPGNHDYPSWEVNLVGLLKGYVWGFLCGKGSSPGGVPYFVYFGGRAGPPDKGYYSYSLGTWHIVVLNSNIDVAAGSIQELWLRKDLKANRTPCVLAYWHHPLFSSGRHGDNPRLQDIWRTLYEFGVDVVVNGHDHDYERFAPQTPEGKKDEQRGIREFVVGTGGAHLYRFQKIHANSEVRDHSTWGVLKFTLHAASYDWEFIPVAGGTFRDHGRALCSP